MKYQYNYVEYEDTCPACENVITKFRTYNFLISTDWYDTLSLEDVYDFFIDCPKCDTYIEYVRVGGEYNVYVWTPLFTMSQPNLLLIRDIITIEDALMSLRNKDPFVRAYCESRIKKSKKAKIEH